MDVGEEEIPFLEEEEKMFLNSDETFLAGGWWSQCYISACSESRCGKMFPSLISWKKRIALVREYLIVLIL